ncbi:hypothetical protein V8F20_003092 [Naviculisporaceae sp. PSN 640]
MSHLLVTNMLQLATSSTTSEPVEMEHIHDQIIQSKELLSEACNRLAALISTAPLNTEQHEKLQRLLTVYKPLWERFDRLGVENKHDDDPSEAASRSPTASSHTLGRKRGRSSDLDGDGEYEREASGSEVPCKRAMFSGPEAEFEEDEEDQPVDEEHEELNVFVVYENTVGDGEDCDEEEDMVARTLVYNLGTGLVAAAFAAANQLQVPVTNAVPERIQTPAAALLWHSPNLHILCPAAPQSRLRCCPGRCPRWRSRRGTGSSRNARIFHLADRIKNSIPKEEHGKVVVKHQQDP